MIQEVVTVSASALGGGALFKILERVFWGKKDEAQQLRLELREENLQMKEAIDDVTKQFNDFKEKYYELLRRFKELESDHNINKKDLERITKRLKRYENYRDQSETLKKIAFELQEYANHKDAEILITSIKAYLAAA